MDARLRARGDLAAGDDRLPARPARARPHLRAAAGGGQAPGPVGRAPAARARWPGLRPGQARPHARDPRDVAVRAQRVRQPGARLGQLGDPRAGRHRRAEGALAASAAGRRPEVRLLDDRARERRLGPDRAAHARRARRRRLGPQRPQVVLLERVDRRLPHRHGGHRPRRAPPPARLDVRRAGRHARRHHRARRADDGAPRRVLRQARQPRRDPLRGRAPRPRGAAGGGRCRLPHRPAPSRPRAHPPLHALAGRISPRVRHALRARDLPLRAGRRAGREADGPELDRGLGRADAGGTAHDAPRRVGDGHAGRRRPRARTSR